MTSIYPGSFDPITYGHLDIIKRASRYTDKLIVAVLNNSAKSSLLTAEEKLELITKLVQDEKNVEVKAFSGLLVDFAKENGANQVIRGLRALTDFDYEFQLALTNRTLNSELETFFIPASMQHLYLSSSVAKEVFRFGGNVDFMVPPEVKEKLREKYENQQAE